MRQVSFDGLPLPKVSRRALKIPFGLKEGRMWSPKHVPAGRNCGCVCPACESPLVAKAADSECRRPHFAHLRESNCRAGYETALHRKAKEILAEHATVQLPAWDGEPGMPNPPMEADDSGEWIVGERVDFPAREALLNDIRVEEKRGDYTPDVICGDDRGELFIEVRVSHAVDPLKRRRIQSEGKRMIEIDLSDLPPDALLDDSSLVEHVLRDVSNRYWLSCPEATEQWRDAHRRLKEAVAKRNREIGRQQLAQETLQREAQRQLEKGRNRREAIRLRERLKYEAELRQLPDLVAPSRIEELLSTYFERDKQQAEAYIAPVVSKVVRNVLRACGPNSWIYRVHPWLWQAAAYRGFVLNRPPGAHFNQRDLARWVMQKFGREEELYRLFRHQYIARDSARKAGYSKRRISSWVLTDLENRQIPDFYKPINTFVDRLVEVGALERVQGIIGEIRTPTAVNSPARRSHQEAG